MSINKWGYKTQAVIISAGARPIAREVQSRCNCRGGKAIAAHCRLTASQWITKLLTLIMRLSMHALACSTYWPSHIQRRNIQLYSEHIKVIGGSEHGANEAVAVRLFRRRRVNSVMPRRNESRWNIQVMAARRRRRGFIANDPANEYKIGAKYSKVLFVQRTLSLLYIFSSVYYYLFDDLRSFHIDKMGNLVIYSLYSCSRHIVAESALRTCFSARAIREGCAICKLQTVLRKLFAKLFIWFPMESCYRWLQLVSLTFSISVFKIFARRFSA